MLSTRFGDGHIFGEREYGVKHKGNWIGSTKGWFQDISICLWAAIGIYSSQNYSPT